MLGVVVCRPVDNRTVSIYALVLLACNHLVPNSVVLVEHLQFDRIRNIVVCVSVALENYLAVEVEDTLNGRTELNLNLLCSVGLDSRNICSLAYNHLLAVDVAEHSYLIVGLLLRAYVAYGYVADVVALGNSLSYVANLYSLHIVLHDFLNLEAVQTERVVLLMCSDRETVVVDAVLGSGELILYP